MLYAREIMELLAAYPGRPFKMIQIVRHVRRGVPHTPQEWEAARKAARRALICLEEAGSVVIVPATANGGTTTYAWRKPGHELDANREGNRENIAREVAPVGYDNPGFHSVSIAMQHYSAHMRRAN